MTNTSSCFQAKTSKLLHKKLFSFSFTLAGMFEPDLQGLGWILRIHYEALQILDQSCSRFAINYARVQFIKTNEFFSGSPFLGVDSTSKVASSPEASTISMSSTCSRSCPYSGSSMSIKITFTLLGRLEIAFLSTSLFVRDCSDAIFYWELHAHMVNGSDNP